MDINKIKRIHEGLKDGTIIPLLCEGVYEFEKDGRTQSLQSYIFEEFKKYWRETDIEHRCKLEEGDLSPIQSMLNESYVCIDRMRVTHHSIIENYPDENDNIFHKQLYNILMDGDSVKIGMQVKDYIADFLKAYNFNLILTTNCFPILEQKVFNNILHTSYGPNYEDESNNVTSDNVQTSDIYHIFGKATSSEDYSLGIDERSILMRLHQYLGSNPLSDLIAKLNPVGDKRIKKLLVIGNTMPDWMFRVTMTAIYGQNVFDGNIPKGYYFDYSRNEDNEFIRLRNFLSDSSFNFVDIEKLTDNSEIDIVKDKQEPAREFFRQLTEKAKDFRHDIFLAHSSAENDLTKELADRLNVKLKVWWDKGKDEEGNYNLSLGRAYWAGILEAMRHSSHFIPIISDSYYEKISQKVEKEHLDDKKLDDAEYLYKLNKEMGYSAALVELLAADYIYRTKFKKYECNYCIPFIVSNNIKDSQIDNISMPTLFQGNQALRFDQKKDDKAKIVEQLSQSCASLNNNQK